MARLRLIIWIKWGRARQVPSRAWASPGSHLMVLAGLGGDMWCWQQTQDLIYIILSSAPWVSSYVFPCIFFQRIWVQVLISSCLLQSLEQGKQKGTPFSRLTHLLRLNVSPHPTHLQRGCTAKSPERSKWVIFLTPPYYKPRSEGFFVVFADGDRNNSTAVGPWMWLIQICTQNKNLKVFFADSLRCRKTIPIFISQALCLLCLLTELSTTPPFEKLSESRAPVLYSGRFTPSTTWCLSRVL